MPTILPKTLYFHSLCENLIGGTDDSTQHSQITSQTDTWKTDVHRDIHIPEHVLYYIIMFNFWGPGLCVTIFGIVNNMLNITTFLKQGLGDAVNISLLGLAISDLGSLVAGFMTNICLLPPFQTMDLPFVVMDFMYMWGWLHVLLTRVSAWITAYITFERCLCITYPLKVKAIITTKRTVTYIVILYLIMIASVVPVYLPVRASSIFDPAKNKTAMGIIFMEGRGDIEAVSFVVNNLLPMSAFTAVVTCTTILVRNLQKKAKWRIQSTSTGHKRNMIDRDAKVIKMVVFISTAFIVCTAPGTVVYIWMMIDPEMRVDGRHLDLFLATFTTTFHLESINASLNIFIYLRMSSKFKSAFLQTFGCVRCFLPADTKTDNH